MHTPGSCLGLQPCYLLVFQLPVVPSLSFLLFPCHWNILFVWYFIVWKVFSLLSLSLSFFFSFFPSFLPLIFSFNLQRKEPRFRRCDFLTWLAREKKQQRNGIQHKPLLASQILLVPAVLKYMAHFCSQGIKFSFCLW